MAKPKQPGKLETHTVSDPAMGYTHPIHLLRGPADQPQRLCLFLDGELYLQKMHVLPVVQDMLDRHALPPVTFAFLDHLTMQAREQEYTCNDQFGRFMIKKVLPWLEQEIPGLQPGHHLIGGLSLSGLASAWLALQYPSHFRYCLSQSGSFWWNDQRFLKIAAHHKPITNRFKPITNRFWLSVGDQENEIEDPLEATQIDGVKNALGALKNLGATVHYNEYHGGHDLKYWRAELEEALSWLLSDDG